MIRVQVAVDSYLVRTAVATALRYIDGFDVIAETDDGQTGADRSAELLPDVIVLSEQAVRSPSWSVSLYRAASPASKVVLVLISQRAVDCGRCGADAALDAGDGIEELAAAIRQVIRGDDG